MGSGWFKNNVAYAQIACKYYTMYKDDLALNNPQGLIWHRPQPNQTKPIQIKP